MRFTYWDSEFDGFDHPYNETIRNERAVEIPIAQRWLTEVTDGPSTGLEVGNVLGHYGLTGHRVVDLYEEAEGVENLDVFDVGGRYDWIVSISTLEHVRWDKPPRDEGGSVAALQRLRNLLVFGGRMLVTVPTGHHPAFDAYLAKGARSQRCCTLVRAGDTWVQTRRLAFLPYSTETKAASVWIGEW